MRCEKICNVIDGKNYKVQYCDTLSSMGNPRYVVFDTETGEILDNAEGYGYKSEKNAYKAYGWKRAHKDSLYQEKQGIPELDMEEIDNILRKIQERDSRAYTNKILQKIQAAKEASNGK